MWLMLAEAALRLKRVPAKVWVIGALTLILLAGTWYASHRIKSHFDYISDLESSNTELTQERNRLREGLDLAKKINNDNQAAYDTSVRQLQNARRIADEARLAAEKRADRYRSLYNDLQDVPPEDRQSVDPVIRGVIDRLFPDDASGTSADRDRP